MLNLISNWWSSSNFWGKLYLILLVGMFFVFVTSAIDSIKNRPKKKIDFITNAQKNGCETIGKLVCLTLHGKDQPEYYLAEYMYIVDNERYFVTYKIGYGCHIDDNKESINADMLMVKLRSSMVFFYKKGDPETVISKFEIFTSHDCIHQTETAKKNIWRDTEKDWDKPIDLVQYSG